LEGQLAADDGDGPADAGPAPIDLRAGDDARWIVLAGAARGPVVIDGIEERDDLPVHVERVRHVHVAAQRAAHPLTEDRLAVSGWTVEEHGLAGVHRRSEPLENGIADDQMRE